MDKDQFIEKLELIDAPLPQFKNSLTYASADWRDFEALSVTWPVHRKLTVHECVFDLDHVSQAQMSAIPEWLKAQGLKFIAWKSGPEGMHIHFWTKFTGKEIKKALVNIMAKPIENMFGVVNDALPMGHGHIRTEFAWHPTKGYQKILLMDTVSELFPFNDIPEHIKDKVKHVCELPITPTGKTGSKDGKMPTCIKYILSHQFADGRNRLLFVVVSWFKGSGLSDDEIYTRAHEWAKRQGGRLYPQFIWSTIRSSNGTVGCNYRHALLEELGVNMSQCKWEN
jgi:hypothetical protein